MAHIAIVTDSASYISARLRRELGIAVVPLHVQIDGESHSEPDLYPDDFYTRIAAGANVSTSQPSPGEFAEAYVAAAVSGADQILSIHIGSNLSGTVQSARLAAESSSVPVTVVDTGQASFAEGLCVLEAAEAIARGASAEGAEALALAASRAIGNTFVVRGMALPERSGRLASGQPASVEGVPVMALTTEGMKVLTSATTLDEAVETMAGHIEAAAAEGRGLRIGIGHGAAPQIAGALRERIQAMSGVSEIIDYVVGPAIGAHVGPGNAGAVFIARPVLPE
ncbi:MAG TPA: DegV family protein [Dehalococcoidia bacterium]|nr:DegV family protein [Dehalococcoidia bacterium]